MGGFTARFAVGRLGESRRYSRAQILMADMLMAIGTGLGGSAAEITAMGNQLGPITAGSLLQFGVAAQTAGVIGERSTVAKVAQPIGFVEWVNGLCPDVAQTGTHFGDEIANGAVMRQMTIHADRSDTVRVSAAMAIAGSGLGERRHGMACRAKRRVRSVFNRRFGNGPGRRKQRRAKDQGRQDQPEEAAGLSVRGNARSRLNVVFLSFLWVRR